jgi:exopolyphosphatase/guanosine-5'-triphosphate,3'-diphosphate pyrophosphatase
MLEVSAAAGVGGVRRGREAALRRPEAPDGATASAVGPVGVRWRPWMRLGRLHGFDLAHGARVTRLALALSAQLGPAYGLTDADQWLLARAALLHDVARKAGRQQHHKRAAVIIREAAIPVGDRERRLIALVARYHRKALPSLAHEEFAILPSADQFRVSLLAGILRVADGLDKVVPHRPACLCCRQESTAVRILLRATGSPGWNPPGEVPKRDLLESVTARAVTLSACATDGAERGELADRSPAGGGAAWACSRREPLARLLA